MSVVKKSVGSKTGRAKRPAAAKAKATVTADDGKGTAAAKVKVPERVNVETHKDVTHIRRKSKLFVYWKFEPNPKITFVQDSRGLWRFGRKVFATAGAALRWASAELLLKHGVVEPADYATHKK